MRTFADAHARHTAAIGAYTDRARQVTHNQWLRSPEDGKWSPSAITTHLTLTFDAVHTELQGGPPMRMRVAGLKKFIVRLLVMRRILRDGHFPSGAPAPRETRPPAELVPQPEGLRRFLEAASRLDTVLVDASRTRPEVLLTHPYFGRVSLTDGVFISARHIEHHMRQLPARL